LTKTEIITAAFKVWGRNFYMKTSLTQLAKSLGVSKPALYRHFESKKALTSAMAEQFIDSFSESVKSDFENALLIPDADEGIKTIIQSITGFFARNEYALIFSIINIYEHNIDGKFLSASLKARGVNMENFHVILNKKYNTNPVIIMLVFATLTFFMMHFHKSRNFIKEENPSDAEIKEIILSIHDVIKNGLKFSAQKVDVLDFDAMEKRINAVELSAEPEPLFRAVAEAVAEAGPWNTSMEMVAKKMGFSKSSLYGHFKNKKDMLRRLFITEFKRIIEFARNGINMSSDSVEQLYLGIYSIVVYMRSRPEILIAISWIRTRKLDLGKPDKNHEVFRLFEEVKIKSMSNTEEDKQKISHWMLFLLINILTRPFEKDENSNKRKLTMANNDIRMLFKFITLGLGGFIR